MKKQLKNQIDNFKSLFNGYKTTKINIHIPIRNELNSFCKNLNSVVLNSVKSDIEFSPSSIQVPHITLYMGFVEDVSNLIKVIDKLEKLALDYKPFELGFSKPYLKSPRNNYMFLDAYPKDYILGVKQKLENKLTEEIIPLQWDVVNEPPHITFGYSRNKNRMQLAEIFKDYDAPPKMLAEAFEISLCGDRGSCLGVLKTFELNKEEKDKTMMNKT